MNQNENKLYTVSLIFSAVVFIIQYVTKGGLGLTMIAHVLFIHIFAGLIMTYFVMIKNSQIKSLIISIIIPLLVIPYILKMTLTPTKKILTIFTMGAFTMFLLVLILQIVLTPQM